VVRKGKEVVEKQESREEEEEEEESDPEPGIVSTTRRTVLFRMELVDYVAQIQILTIPFRLWLQKVCGFESRTTTSYLNKLPFGKSDLLVVTQSNHLPVISQYVVEPLDQGMFVLNTL